MVFLEVHMSLSDNEEERSGGVLDAARRIRELLEGLDIPFEIGFCNGFILQGNRALPYVKVYGSAKECGLVAQRLEDKVHTVVAVVVKHLYRKRCLSLEVLSQQS